MSEWDGWLRSSLINDLSVATQVVAIPIHATCLSGARHTSVLLFQRKARSDGIGRHELLRTMQSFSSEQVSLQSHVLSQIYSGMRQTLVQTHVKIWFAKEKCHNEQVVFTSGSLISTNAMDFLVNRPSEKRLCSVSPPTTRSTRYSLSPIRTGWTLMGSKVILSLAGERERMRSIWWCSPTPKIQRSYCSFPRTLCSSVSSSPFVTDSTCWAKWISRQCPSIPIQRRSRYSMTPSLDFSPIWTRNWSVKWSSASIKSSLSDRWAILPIVIGLESNLERKKIECSSGLYSLNSRLIHRFANCSLNGDSNSRQWTFPADNWKWNVTVDRWLVVHCPPFDWRDRNLAFLSDSSLGHRRSVSDDSLFDYYRERPSRHSLDSTLKGDGWVVTLLRIRSTHWMDREISNHWFDWSKR